MSDHPQYRRDATQPSPGQYPVEEPPWARRGGGAEPVHLVKIDRPLYTGMMFGFGLMVASIVLFAVTSVVLGLVGLLLGGLTAPSL